MSRSNGEHSSWGASGGLDTTETHSHLIERFDVSGQLLFGHKVGIWEFFIAPKLVRTAYHVQDKTRTYYQNELIDEEITRDRRDEFFQYGVGAGFVIWKAIVEFDYMLSDEFNSFNVGLGIRSN